MSLYLKYRPKNFPELVGQKHISKTLLSAISQNKISHAYIFFGPRGTGKTSTARLIASTLVCLNPKEDLQSCQTCDTCKDFKEGSLIDVIEIDAASNRGIDEIRDLKEKIHFSPTRAKKKVYIIDEVHMLTKEAFNALLKTLEEPPSHAYFILATTEIHKVPETIISRCQRFDFRRIDENIISEKLREICENEKLSYEIEAINLIAKIAHGGMRDAISILEQLSSSAKITAEEATKLLGLSHEESFKNLFSFLENKDLKTAVSLCGKIYQDGADVYEFCSQYIHYLRDQLLQKVEESANLNPVLKQIECFQSAQEKIKNSVIPVLPLEIACIKFCNTEAINNNFTEGKTEKRTIEEKTPQIKSYITANKLPELKQNTNKNLSAPKEKKAEINSISSLNQAENTNEKTDALIELQKNWNLLISNIRMPALRLSLKEAFPSKIDGENLIIHISSGFHYDRLVQAENIAKLEEEVSKAIGKKLHIHIELSENFDNQIPKINRVARPISQEKEEPGPKEFTPVIKEEVSTPQQNKESEEFDDIAARAADIFGGTLL